MAKISKFTKHTTVITAVLGSLFVLWEHKLSFSTDMLKSVVFVILIPTVLSFLTAPLMRRVWWQSLLSILGCLAIAFLLTGVLVSTASESTITPIGMIILLPMLYLFSLLAGFFALFTVRE